MFKIYFVFSLDFIKFNDIVSSGQRPVASGTRGKSVDQRRPYYLIKQGLYVHEILFSGSFQQNQIVYRILLESNVLLVKIVLLTGDCRRSGAFHEKTQRGATARS